MATFELEESDFAGIIEEDSILEAEVVSVEKKKMPFQDKETGADVFNMEWKFLVDEPDSPHDGANIWGKTSIKFNTHPDCKLKNWSQEVLAAEFDPKFVLDTDMIVGEKCRIVVGIERWNDKKTDEPREKNVVKDVIRSRTKMGAEDAAF